MQLARLAVASMRPARWSLALVALCLASTASSQETARIYYDAHSIPHVFGSTDERALYGLGYHHMLEYPVGTLNTLWLTSGRAAEAWGESYVDEDRLAHLWEVPAIASRHRTEMMASNTFSLIEAYVDGVEAGRAWWAAQPSRLDALLGSNMEVHVDPVPFWLNPVFSPYGKFDHPATRIRITDVTRRLFDASMPITEDHVLHLGAAINSFFLLHSNAGRGNAFPGLVVDKGPFEPETEPNARLASNGWMISAGANPSGNVVTLSDGHVPLNRLAFRPYIVQVSGDTYHATGLTMPGYPAVYLGFNDHISWLVTAPATRHDGTGPVARNRWEVTLDGNRQFSFDGGPSVSLTSVQTSVLQYQPSSGSTVSVPITLEYVDRQGSEPALGFTRYPVILEQPAQAHETIGFEQSAFTTEGSPWEFFFLMGRAQNAGADVTVALGTSKALFGNGMNLMVADSAANMRYEFMARIPQQGSGVSPGQYTENAVLDGTRLDQRWQGFVTNYPSIGEVAPAGGEVWINNNATPDRVEPSRYGTAELMGLPDYVFSDQSIATWRQLRAEELLRPMGAPAPGLDEATSRTIARDQADNWMRTMWPLFLMLSNDPSSFPPFESSPRRSQIEQFMSWVEAHRRHDETDLVNPGYDFVAHPFSRVTVYTTLLRSQYLLRLRRSGGTVEELSLGLDPLHPVHLGTATFDQGGFGANVGAMVAALDFTQRIWERGTQTPRGLQNAHELGRLFQNGMSQLPPPEVDWSDSRFFTEVDSERVTRWGHANMLVLTPHLQFPPERKGVRRIARAILGSATLITLDSVMRGYLYSGLAPPMLTSLPIGFLHTPFFTSVPVQAEPIGGVRHALFTSETKVLFEQASRRGYEQALYPWGGRSLFYYVPHTAGSQTMLSVEVGGDARFMTALGGTEITTSGIAGLNYQSRFQPTQDFVNGTWNLLETDEGMLGTAEYVIMFP